MIKPLGKDGWFPHDEPRILASNAGMEIVKVLCSWFAESNLIYPNVLVKKNVSMEIDQSHENWPSKGVAIKYRHLNSSYRCFLSVSSTVYSSVASSFLLHSPSLPDCQFQQITFAKLIIEKWEIYSSCMVCGKKNDSYKVKTYYSKKVTLMKGFKNENVLENGIFYLCFLLFLDRFY